MSISVGNFSDMHLLVRILHLAKKFPQGHFHHETRLGNFMGIYWYYCVKVAVVFFWYIFNSLSLLKTKNIRFPLADSLVNLKKQSVLIDFGGSSFQMRQDP